MPSSKVQTLQQSLGRKGPGGAVEDTAFAQRLDTAIKGIVDALSALKVHGGVNQEAVIVLLHDKTKLSKRSIRTLFSALDDLHRTYCEPPPPPENVTREL